MRATSATETSPDKTLNTIRVFVSGENTGGLPMINLLDQTPIMPTHTHTTGLPEILTRDKHSEAPGTRWI